MNSLRDRLVSPKPSDCVLRRRGLFWVREKAKPNAELDRIDTRVVVRPASEMWKNRTSVVQPYFPYLPHGNRMPTAMLGMKLNAVVPATA